MPESIEKKLQEFLEQVDYHTICEFPNGFWGFGILKTPENHIIEGVNTVLLYEYALYDSKFNQLRVAMTIEEAQLIINKLNDVIKHNQKTEPKSS